MVEATLRVPALEKLLDYAASGIGSVAGSMLAPWRAGREADARRIAAKGDADVLAILAEGQAGALPMIAEAQENARRQLANPEVVIEGEFAVTEVIEQRVRFQEEKRQRNIGAIVSQAAEQLTDEEVEDREPDHDWAARFFSEAQDVSSEEMQILWARVLAGEVERPGNTSLRALGVLKDLNREAAGIFQRLCSITVSLSPDGKTFLDARVPSMGGNAATNALQDYGLDFGALNVLNEHGLIISDYNSWYDYRIVVGISAAGQNQFVRIPFGFQNSLWVLESVSGSRLDKEFKISGVSLTRAGQELSRVVDLQPNQKYDTALKGFFEKRSLRMVEVETMEPQILSKKTTSATEAATDSFRAD